MNDAVIGRALAAVRRELRLRQSDVGRRAGVDQKVVSLLERGLLERVSVRSFRRVCSALEVDPFLTIRWRGGELDQLIDRVHAGLVERIVSVLVTQGWEVLPEYSFNVYGERGSVDVLAWHAATRTLLIIEVKSVLTDLQATLMSMSRTIRLVPALVAEQRGWSRLALARIIVVAGTRANRTTVERHAATFMATFPGDTAASRRWVANPAGDFAGLWFVAPRPVTPVTAPSSRRKTAGRAQRPPAHVALMPDAPQRKPQRASQAPQA